MRSRRIRGAWSAALLCALVACSGDPRPPAVTTVAPRTLLSDDTDCEGAHVQRARVGDLLESGRLDRAVRVIRRADELCPDSAPESWAQLVRTLSELGRHAEALKLAARIEASAQAGDRAKQAAATAQRKAQSAQPPNVALVREWVKQAQQLRASGNRPAAQRLLDRARVAAELATHKPVAPTLIEDPPTYVSLFQFSDPYVLVEEDRARVFDGTTLDERLRFPLTPKVVSSAMSEDFRYLVTLDAKDATFRIWDLTSGDLVQELTDVPESANPEVNPNDLHYYVGWERFAWANAHTVNIWDLKHQKPYAAFDLHESVPRVRITPDDKTAVSLGNKKIGVWDLESRSLRAQMDRGGTEPIFLDQEIIFVAPDGSVRRCVLATGNQRVIARPGQATSLTLTEDGRYLLVAKPGADLELWNTERVRRVQRVAVLPKDGRKLDHMSNIWTVHLAPDASSALVALPGAKWFGVDLASGKAALIPGQLASTAVGRRLLFAQADPEQKPDVGWVERGRLAPVMRLPSTPTEAAPALSRDGQRVVIALRGGTIVLLDAETLQIEKRFALPPDSERAVDFGKHTPALTLEGWATPNLLHIPTGRLAMAPVDRMGDVLWAGYANDRPVLLTHHAGSVRDWALDDGGRSRTLRGQFEGITRGGRLAERSRSLRSRIVSLPGGSVLREIGATPQQCGALSRDGRWALNISKHTDLELYDLSTPKPPRQAKAAGRVPCPSRVLAGGKLFAVRSYGNAGFWRTEDGTHSHDITPTISGRVIDVSEDGALAAFGDSNGTIEFSGRESDRPRSTHQGADGVVGQGRFSTNGKRLAVAFRSGVIRVFATMSGRSLARLEGDRPVVALDFDQSGDLLVSLTGQRDPTESYSTYGGDRLRLWSIPEESLLATLVPAHNRELPVVLAPTGEVDPGSDGTNHLGCIAGIHIFPFALCEERFSVPGLLSRALAGEVAYRDP
jgi:WD40 repeat protein